MMKPTSRVYSMKKLYWMMTTARSLQSWSMKSPRSSPQKTQLHRRHLRHRLHKRLMIRMPRLWPRLFSHRQCWLLRDHLRFARVLRILLGGLFA